MMALSINYEGLKESNLPQIVKKLNLFLLKRVTG
jgi:hypothetical protein